MTEQVIRHRGGGRDEDGRLLPSEDLSMTAFAVAPGARQGLIEDFSTRGREGETIDFTVYFAHPADVTSEDELTVRGKRCTTAVNAWTFGGFDGREVLCTRSEG